MNCRRLVLMLHGPGIAAQLALSACAAEVPPRHFPVAAESLLEAFRRSDRPTAGAYDSLFRYFILGWETYRLPGGAGAVYPGLPSRHGAGPDQMEGFARLAPLVAAWISSGRPSSIELYPGRSVDLGVLLREGVLAGTNPQSPAYWGTIADHDQRIVEASDIALILWLCRSTLWQSLTGSQRAQVARWLSQVNGKRVSDNNWHLLVTFTNVVLDALGQPADLEGARQHYQRLKTFYRGDGWFSDGPSPAFDYYNAWGIHYQLYWLTRVDPSWDPDFIRNALASFLGNYRYLFGPDGFPSAGAASATSSPATP